MTPHEDLPREIKEEMGLLVTHIETQPCYFVTGTKTSKGYWNVNVVYETKLASLDFTPTEECVAIKFISKEDEGWLRNAKKHGIVSALLKEFCPANH